MQALFGEKEDHLLPEEENLLQDIDIWKIMHPKSMIWAMNGVPMPHHRLAFSQNEAHGLQEAF